MNREDKRHPPRPIPKPKPRQEVVAEIERALREALEPFLHTALIPGGILHETDRVLIKHAMHQVVESVLRKQVQQKSFPTLQTIKDATTKENFGDSERNWLISECERLTRIVEKAVSVLCGKDWCPQAGTDKGRMAEFSQASEEKENVEPS